MSKVKVESKFGQPFMLDQATILSYVRVERDADGGKLETPFVAMLLDNGEGINANLQAISRALSRSVRWEHLRFIKGAKVTYVSGHREEGAEFTWRPSDTRQIKATATGDYTSMLGIDVQDRYADTLEGLPDYVAKPDDDTASDMGEANGEDKIPEGAKLIAEPLVVNKGKQK